LIGVDKSDAVQSLGAGNVLLPVHLLLQLKTASVYFDRFVVISSFVSDPSLCLLSVNYLRIVFSQPAALGQPKILLIVWSRFLEAANIDIDFAK
jgi:hypothetical protein